MSGLFGFLDDYYLIKLRIYLNTWSLQKWFKYKLDCHQLSLAEHVEERRMHLLVVENQYCSAGVLGKMPGVSSQQPVPGMWGYGKIKLKFYPVEKRGVSYGFCLFLVLFLAYAFSYMDLLDYFTRH